MKKKLIIMKKKTKKFCAEKSGMGYCPFVLQEKKIVLQEVRPNCIARELQEGLCRNTVHCIVTEARHGLYCNTVIVPTTQGAGRAWGAGLDVRRRGRVTGAGVGAGTCAG